MKRTLLYSFCLFSIAGFALYGPARGPDAPQSWWNIGGAFLLFLAFCCSVYAAGRIFLGKFFKREEDFLFDFGAGLGVFIMAGQILGLAGLLAYLPSVWMTGFLCLPVAIFAIGRKRPIEFQARFPSIAEILAALTCFLLFLLTWIPDPMPDPLWYHLESARWWMDAGRIYLPRENMALLLATGWDSLYLWTSHFLGSANGGGLIAGHIAGQWLHFFGGGACSLIALSRYYRRWFPELEPDWCLLVAIISFFSASQQTTVFLAKNDWGATFFLLLGLISMNETERGNSRFFLSGIFIGLAVSAKITVLFIAVPLLALELWPRRGAGILPMVPGLAAGSGIFFWRNYALTGNPFHPVFSAFFPRGDLGPLWKRIEFYEGNGFFSVAGKEYLLSLVWRDSPFLGLTVLAGIMLWAAPRRLRSEFAFCAVVAGAGLFFLLKVGSHTEFRLFGLGCLLAAGSGLALALSWLEGRKDFLPGELQRNLLTLGIFAVGAYFTSYPWVAPAAAFSQASPPEVIRSHFGGTALAWVRLNIPRNQVVAAANEYRLYYLSDIRAYRIWDNIDLDQEIRRAATLREAVGAMRKAGIDYLLFTRMDWDRYFKRDVLDALEASWGRFRETVVFGNENSKVIDLRRLEEAVIANDLPLRPE